LFVFFFSSQKATRRRAVDSEEGSVAEGEDIEGERDGDSPVGDDGSWILKDAGAGNNVLFSLGLGDGDPESADFERILPTEEHPEDNNLITKEGIDKLHKTWWDGGGVQQGPPRRTQRLSDALDELGTILEKMKTAQAERVLVWVKKYCKADVPLPPKGKGEFSLKDLLVRRQGDAGIVTIPIMKNPRVDFSFYPIQAIVNAHVGDPDWVWRVKDEDDGTIRDWTSAAKFKRVAEDLKAPFAAVRFVVRFCVFFGIVFECVWAIFFYSLKSSSCQSQQRWAERHQEQTECKRYSSLFFESR
jgi:hypothetical protein